MNEDVRTLDELREIAKNMNMTTEDFLHKANISALKEIYELQQKINRIIEIIELNQYSYGYQIKEEILKESDVK